MSRDEIFQAHPWLLERDQKIVIGDDLDSIMSAMYMKHHLNWDVLGYYVGYKKLYLNKDVLIDDVIFLDLDICYPYSKSIGHHIINDGNLDTTHPAIINSINPNLLRDITTKKFKLKYPLATIHFLHALYNYNYDIDNPLKTVIWTPDSAWINGQSHRFRSNVDSWIKYMELDYLRKTFETIDTEQFEITIKGIYDSFKVNGFTKEGQIESRHTKTKGHQCQFNPETDIYKINKLSDLISTMVEWNPIQFPSVERMRMFSGERMSSSHPKDLLSFINCHATLFSYAMDYAQNMNLTFMRIE